MTPSPSAPWRGAALLAATAALFVAACSDRSTGPAGAGAIDAAQSEVLIAARTVAAGDSVLLTLRARDARGRSRTTGGGLVAFSATGGGSTGIIGQVFDRGDGRYQATFHGRRSGSPATIGASIDGVPVTSPLPTLQVQPGPYSPTDSYLSVSPRTVVAGDSARVVLHTVDAFGNPLDSGGLRVRVRVTGGSGTGEVGTVTDNGDGTYTATFTGGTAGTPITVTATVNDTELTSPPPTVTVARGVAVDRSIVHLSADTTAIDAGVRLTLVVHDSAGVRRTSGGETVEFFLPDDAPGTIGPVSDHDDGSYDATLTVTQPATLQVGVRLNGVEKGGPAPSLTVLPPPLAPQRSRVQVSATAFIAGQQGTFTVELRDVTDALVRSAHTVEFTLDNTGTSGGTVSKATTSGDGRYTATFVATRAGTPVTVGATIDGTTLVQMLDSLGESHLPSLVVRAGAASADSSELAALQSVLTPGDSTLVQLNARDPYGNRVETGGRTVTFRRSAAVGASVGRLGPVRDGGDGSYSAWYVAQSAGAPDAISATIDGRAVRTPSPTVTVIATCPNSEVSYATSELVINDRSPSPQPRTSLVLPSGIATTLTLQVRDAKGCTITRPLTVTFGAASTDSGTVSTGIMGPVVDLRDGRYVATVTGEVAGAATTLVASIGGTRLSSVPVTLTVVPGDFSVRRSDVSVERSTLAVGDSVIVQVRARDEAGNAIAAGGRQVTFAVGSGDGAGAFRPVTDHGDGTYRAWFVATRSGTGVTITARADGTALTRTIQVAISP
ncbi:MAG: hypothetical protein IPK85_18590 [Gemmatimonadetes bacterium]|nr:hypothetical protein [Gemmatimonadota bacterium]